MSETKPLAEPYPLYWPENRPRCRRREYGHMRSSFAVNRDDILHEVRLLGGKELILSTNVSLRKDGLPYADMAQPDDPGVAVYFQYKDKAVCFACDRWVKVEHNLRAVAMTIEALRGIARWGTGDMMEAAFRGFTALPAPGRIKSWRETLGLSENEYVTHQSVRNAYMRLRSSNHPDNGGDADAFNQIRAAYAEAVKELSG